MGKCHHGVEAANTAVVVTIPALSSDTTVKLESYGCSFDVAPAAATLFSVESPSGTVIQSWWITAAGPAPINPNGSCVEGVKGQSLVLRLAAATGCIGRVNAIVRNH